jgi:uncharacterized protein (UPF0332 family)
MEWTRFNWTTYLNLAEDLAGREDDAARRSAVSRAYYAVFCDARNALEIRSLFDRREAESHHQEVWDAFEDDPRREWKRIGAFGHLLREARRKADYDDEISNLPHLTEGAMRQARKLNVKLADL